MWFQQDRNSKSTTRWLFCSVLASIIKDLEFKSYRHHANVSIGSRYIMCDVFHPISAKLCKKINGLATSRKSARFREVMSARLSNVMSGRKRKSAMRDKSREWRHNSRYDRKKQYQNIELYILNSFKKLKGQGYHFEFGPNWDDLVAPCPTPLDFLLFSFLFYFTISWYLPFFSSPDTLRSSEGTMYNYNLALVDDVLIIHT